MLADDEECVDGEFCTDECGAVEGEGVGGGTGDQ